MKLLGSSVDYMVMKEKLKVIWKPVGGIDVVDIGNDFFFWVKFDYPDNREKAILGGPWIMFDHYLAVRE